MTIFYSTILFFLLIFIFIEYYLLIISIRKIPLRILINGTRGKSTTVKIIHKILTNSGMKVYGKITGNHLTLINPDGNKINIKRHSPASIKENIKLLYQFAKDRPDAVVMECMSIQKETQKMLGKSIFAPHWVLITNVLPDHKEVMGDSLIESLHTQLECLDTKSNLIVGEEISNFLSNQYVSQNILVAENQTFDLVYDNVPSEIIIENWSIIKRLANELSITNQITKASFNIEWRKIDKSIKTEINKFNLEIWNLFSANDVSTTAKFIEHSAKKIIEHKNIFLLNTRKDRPLRSKDFTDYICNNFTNSDVWIIGNGQYLAKKLLVKNNYPEGNIHIMQIDKLIELIAHDNKEFRRIYCIGNYKGTEKIVSWITKNSKTMGR